MSRFPHLPARILKVCIGALTVFSHVYRPDGVNSTSLFLGCVLETGSSCENGGLNAHSKDRGRGEEPPIARVQVLGQPAVAPSC